MLKTDVIFFPGLLVYDCDVYIEATKICYPLTDETTIMYGLDIHKKEDIKILDKFIELEDDGFFI